MSDYLTSSALKSTLSLDNTTYADADIAAAISAASRWIDERCNRRFYADSDAQQIRYYRPAAPGVLLIHDADTLTSVDVDFNGDGVYEENWTDGSQFFSEPYNHSDPYWPIERLRINPWSGRYWPTFYPKCVKVTAKFGWTTTPAAVVEACTIKASQLLRRAREAPFGIVSVGIQGQSLQIGSADPQLEDLLAPYIRITV